MTQNNRWPEGTAVAYNGNSIVVIHKGAYFSVTSNTERWSSALEAFKNYDIDTLINIIKPIHSVVKEFEEKGYNINIHTGEVEVDGIPLQGKLSSRISESAAAGVGFDHLINFARKLRNNPSKTAVDELFLFLESSSTPMPILTNGNFLAYKRVRENFTDCHSGTFDNSVGQVVSMARNEVCDDRRTTCSDGLHFCSLDYLQNFGSSGNNDRVVIVEIDPADVVSIPCDYNNSKGRTCKYTVVEEYKDYHDQTNHTARWESSTSVLDKNNNNINDFDDVIGLMNPRDDIVGNSTWNKKIDEAQESTDFHVIVNEKTPNVNKTLKYKYFGTREKARDYVRENGGKFIDWQNVVQSTRNDITSELGTNVYGHRWFVQVY